MWLLKPSKLKNQPATEESEILSKDLIIIIIIIRIVHEVHNKKASKHDKTVKRWTITLIHNIKKRKKQKNRD